MIDRAERGDRAVHSASRIRRAPAPKPLTSSASWRVQPVLKSPGFITAPRGRPDARFFVGKGKVDELAAAVRDSGADVVLVSRPLSPVQERNIEARVQPAGCWTAPP